MTGPGAEGFSGRIQRGSIGTEETAFGSDGQGRWTVNTGFGGRLEAGIVETNLAAQQPTDLTLGPRAGELTEPRVVFTLPSANIDQPGGQGTVHGAQLSFIEGATASQEGPSTPDQPHNPNDLVSPERVVASLEFLKDGDVETAHAILDILHDPVNRSGYVSPHKHYSEDPECKDIFGKVNNPDYYIVAARDESRAVVATMTWHYDPDRARVVTWYLGGVRSDMQRRGVGKVFYEKCAALTFETRNRTNNALPLLILGKVILNEGNEDLQFNDNTRGEFPNVYRMLKDLPFVRHIGDQGPSIARDETVGPDDTEEEDFLAVGLFEIRRKKFRKHQTDKQAARS